jgi:hypothetical protein
MSRALLAGILLAVIAILYGIQLKTAPEKKVKIDTFVDASGSNVDSSGNAVDYGFAEIFSKFLNRLVDSANFRPSEEPEKVIDIITTPDQEMINNSLEKQMTPMIQQGIDALRLASSAQNNY